MMKQYLGYSETSNYSNWDFYKKNIPSDRHARGKRIDDRFSCRYVGLCTKKDMIEIIGRDIVRSMNWVRERVSETGNDYDIELCKKHPGCIIVYNHDYSGKREIIEVINIKERRAKIEAEKRKNSNT